MQLLPKWVLPPTLPSIYDSESYTSLEMVAKVYGAMSTLIEEYNKFADSVNTAMGTFTESEKEAREKFETDVTKVYRQFTCQMDDYLRLNLDDTATKVIMEGMKEGKIFVLTDETLTKNDLPADAAAVGQRAAVLAKEIATERARINNILSLPEGSTTLDAELIDIRFGANGKVYVNAGEAVRRQFDDINNVVQEIATLVPKTYPLIADEHEMGGVNSTTGEDSTYKADRTCRLKDIVTAEHDTTLVAVNGAEAMKFVFYDANDAVISATDWSVSQDIPAGSRYRYALMLNEKDTVARTLEEILENFYFIHEYEILRRMEEMNTGVRPYNQIIKASNFAELLPSMDTAEPNVMYPVLKTKALTTENWPAGVGNATFVTLTPNIGGETYKVQLMFDIDKNNFLFRTNVSSKWNGWKSVKAEATNGVVYVAPDGSDSADGSEENPYATFKKAISSGANVIVAYPGTYAQTVSVSGVNNLTIRAQKKAYNGSFQDALNPKVIFDSSQELNQEDIDIPGMCGSIYYAEPGSRMHKVFVTKELPVEDDTGSESVGYNANVWEIRTDGSIVNDHKLVPVLSQEECIATKGTFFFDGDYITIHPTNDDLTGKKFVVPSDDDIIVNIKNCDNLVLEDIQTEHGCTLGINIENCRNAVITDCNAHHSAAGGGFRLNYTNAKLSHCKAYKNRNDGFNMHENGYTELINCYALYNEDDGVSHHQGCSGTVIGGEYSYNGSGGVTPAFGAEVNVYNAIMRGNLYGLQVLGATGYANRTMIAMNNIMTENAMGGLFVSKNTVVGMNHIFGNDTTEIELGTKGVYIDLAANA